jgi:protein-tyrosine phosphatase
MRPTQGRTPGPVSRLARARDNRDVTYRVCFVCSGNICRSPTAEIVLRAYVADAGLSGRVEVDSAGTGTWHVGRPADPRSLRTLSDAGYDGSAHQARQFDPAWFTEVDLVVALDRSHEEDLRALAPDEGARARVVLLRSFDPVAMAAGTLEVADPFHAGPAEFERVLAEVEAGCAGLVTYITTLLDPTVPR